jgi:hypothetical protein
MHADGIVGTMRRGAWWIPTVFLLTGFLLTGFLLVILEGCTATPLPTPPSAAPERMHLFTFRDAHVVLTGTPASLERFDGISLRVTGPAGHAEARPLPDGSFFVVVGGTRADRYFLEALLPQEDRFLVAITGGASDGDALSIDSGPDSDRDGSPDAIDCAPLDASVGGRRCATLCGSEACNARDDDCDGAVDEGCDGTLCMSDADCVLGAACVMGTCQGIACMSSGDCPGGTACVSGRCDQRGGDADGDGYRVPEDCVDADPDVHPDAIELCNDVDDNCNGLVDEMCVSSVCMSQSDCPFAYDCLSGVCSPASCLGMTPCPMGTECMAGTCRIARRDADLDGFPSSSDCDDTNPMVFPGAIETCNGIDDDCDGVLDEGCGGTMCAMTTDCPTGYDCLMAACRRLACMTDADCPGGSICASAECRSPMGDADMDGHFAPADCDDTNPMVNPSVMETCNGVDDDCDSRVDEGC